MAALIRLRPGVDWQAPAGLFDFALEFLVGRLSDRDAAERELPDGPAKAPAVARLRELAELTQEGGEAPVTVG